MQEATYPDLISKKAKELEQKYLIPISINEKILTRKKGEKRKKTPFQKTMSIIFDVLCSILIALALFMCFDAAVSHLQGVCSSFLGYSNMRVITGSMIWSGFDIGDTIVVRAVQPHTLRGGGYRVGDKIAFYEYSGYDSNFDLESATLLTEDQYAPKVQYDYSAKLLLGFRNDLMKEAAKANSRIIFHHIKDVYIDSAGKYWFKTYGSSNADPIRVDEGDTRETHVQQEIGSPITMGVDTWYVSEDLVVGIYDDSGMAHVVSTVVGVISASGGIILMLIPILLIAIVIILQCIKDIQMAKLEMAVVEEKKKLTDEICVLSDLGFRMDKDNKLKVLSQASEAEWDKYVSLLWKAGETPSFIKDYASTRRILLAPTIKMLQLNRTCEAGFKNGDDKFKLAEFYMKEREKLDLEQKNISSTIKSLPKDFTLEDLDMALSKASS